MSIKGTIVGCVQNVAFKAQKHSPVILFGVGCVGVVATAVAAFKAHPRADFVLMQHSLKMDDIKKATEVADPEDNYNPKVDKLRVCAETAKEMAITFGPTVALGVGSLVSFGVAFKILNDRYLGAVAWGTSVMEAFTLYRSRVKSEIGPNADMHFRYGTEYNIEENEVEDENGDTHLVVTHKPVYGNDAKIGDLDPTDIARYFDEENDNWDPNPTFNLMFLRSQEKMANDKLQSSGHLFLNEVYDMLGFDDTPIGAVVGWLKDETTYVDFGLGKRDSESVRSFINGNRSVVPLDFNVTGVIWNKI